MIQEKTNRADAYMFKQILDELLKDNMDNVKVSHLEYDNNKIYEKIVGQLLLVVLLCVLKGGMNLKYKPEQFQLEEITI